MARSSLRAKPYVVEIQRHYHLDERTRKDKKGYPVRIHSNSRTSREEEIPRRKHPHLQPSKSNSLEYEDIYNQRNHLWENSHLKQQGRWSFRDDGGYGRVREHTRRSPGIARPTEIRVMINGEAGGTGHRERRNTDGTRYQNRTVGDNGPMRAKYEAVQTSTSREGTPKQNRVSKDKKDNQNEDLELWIARQTSFPRKQEETSNQRILGNDTTSHELVSNQSKSLQDNSNNGIPPQVSLKPPCPQTSRSASPTPSVRSNQSGGSRASHHSARSGTSEVSVKSILKKPNVGRVVLREEPSSYTLCAVLSCILCFPFGIYALTTSRQVKEAVNENDYQLALSSSRKVKNFCFGVLLAYIGILAIAGALVAVYFTTGKIF